MSARAMEQAAEALWGGRVLVLLVGVALLLIVGIVLLVSAPPTIDDVLPGQSLQVDADRDFTAAEQARGDALASQVRPFALTASLVSVVIALLLGFTAWGGSIVRGVGSATGTGEWGSWVLGPVALLAIGQLVVLPLAAAARAPRVEAGVLTQPWGGWLLDVGRSFAVTAIVVVIAILALRVAMALAPLAWWVVVAGGAAVLVVALSFLQPLVVEPLFNRFTPLPEGAQRTELLQLADDAGVPVSEVLVADASRRTTALNAYVSGLGSSRRVVVYDTLLESAPPAEVRAVVAHELAHVANNDVRNGTLLGALATAGGVCVVIALLGTAWVRVRSGATGYTDPAIVAPLLALVTLATAVTTPIVNEMSRRVEARADVDALTLTREPQTQAELHRRLALAAVSNVTPPPALHWWFGTHPQTIERIALTRAWADLNDAPAVPDLAGSGSIEDRGGAE